MTVLVLPEEETKFSSRFFSKRKPSWPAQKLWISLGTCCHEGHQIELNRQLLQLLVGKVWAVSGLAVSASGRRFSAVLVLCICVFYSSFMRPVKWLIRHCNAVVVIAAPGFSWRSGFFRHAPRKHSTVDSISYVLFLFEKNKIARLSDSLQIFRRALLWSHLFPTVWMSSLAQKIIAFLITRLSLPCIFGRFEWKIENKKYT